MERFTSIDVLCATVREKMGRRARFVIGIDGMCDVGKTTLAKKLALRFKGRSISLDDHVDGNKGTYVRHLRCSEIRTLPAASTLPIIIEGVCLRSVENRCGISFDIHVYVRRINEQGRWNDEELCLASVTPEVLKERDRELRLLANRFLQSKALRRVGSR